MSTESGQPAKLLERMKQELYAIIDGYSNRLNVDGLKSYINSFSIPRTTPTQTLFSRLHELKRGPYLTLENFSQIRQETPQKISYDLSNSLKHYEHDIKVYGEDAIAHLVLSRRAYYALSRGGIKTITQLRNTDDSTLRMRGVGPKTFSEIKQALKEFDQLKQTG